MTTESGHKRRHRGEGRQALIDATIRTVSTKGLARLSYRSVAAEAGVGHTLAQHHFGTIDALLAETHEYCTEVSIAQVESNVGETDVEAYVHSLVDAALESPDLQVFMYELNLQSRLSPAVAERTATLYATYEDAVVEALSRLGVTIRPGTGTMVVAMLDGIIYQAVSMPGQKSRELSKAISLLASLLTTA
ncbi:TetR family transcriptional regulator [Nocardioides sp. GY 10127]|uniref:TetR/AcrR family transcriptional regulator n=1 Tax=Nocardioides sp. GY 10127 TaxID=2569762 RepID=UPI0010A7D27E|nr:TetR family transcriptional regulator [Nocardioides sp. GY 10127]TIC80032.1 TetR family transcriptional regulator [Nocardioides sp. GY 10127]